MGTESAPTPMNRKINEKDLKEAAFQLELASEVLRQVSGIDNAVLRSAAAAAAKQLAEDHVNRAVDFLGRA